MPVAVAAVVLLALLAPLCKQCAAQKREVYSCRELREALADGGVRHIVAMQAGNFNCSADDLPADVPLKLVGREVLLEGQGPGLVYFDYNMVKGMHVLVSDGGGLTVRNVWLDHCLANDVLALCICSVLEGGWIDLVDARLSDIACVNARRSPAIQEVENRMRYTLGARARIGKDLDARTMLIKDSGWLSGGTHDSKWRFSNLTLTCTGNTTHPLPDARNARAPEYRIAESKGFLLEAPLGKGHFGRVYRGRKRTSGQLVAIKVIDLLPSQRSQVLAAYRECQLLSSVQHDNIVRVFTFYTAKVQRTQRLVEVIPDRSEYVEVGYQVPPQAGSSGGGAAASGSSGQQQGSNGSGFSLGSQQRARGSGGSGATGTPPQGSSGPGSNASSSISDKMEGVQSIQVQLVTQYCDMGTLEQAVKGGVFIDAVTGHRRIRHILLTALEIAAGLEYLHHSDRRMVHRDLSATNILLTTSADDDRGFRALLSDFGLSTVLSADQTHKTSQVKGTVRRAEQAAAARHTQRASFFTSYMSPELFVRDDVSPALDVYSLGIILHMMYTGQDPYQGKSPAMIILAKVREEARLPQLEGCPEAYQQLVWDCTHYERRSRPTAADLVRRLENLLMK
ncbi:hypothetical protein CHLNCDRAFT_138337 [Chlorella variabilis]|uniref:Protein kinase domain-containing protein n=1 Tax=Chlorella variabilis TaxID=554065 RepID=E1ZMT8_CHLVA|nr:hypothetical protein CHLNCDRAFT_138337 [Chlorella variabilis]EFN52857.1 hypothetical protein CHLNCDRAFT_138337 [Chlorella variabilis]|eukprot:XP_005844959.1 hypothetical protein CHLNCDRAFT_138337 [Chlorella variabilis]